MQRQFIDSSKYRSMMY